MNWLWLVGLNIIIPIYGVYSTVYMDEAHDAPFDS